MDALTDDQHGHPTYLALEARDRSLVRAILMAALRYRGDLEAMIDGFVSRPLPAGAHSLRAILHVAGAQILLLDIPAHSAVDLAVECANRDPRNRKFAALVNAVTRRMVKEKDNLLSAIESQPNNAPDWFHAQLSAIYGDVEANEIARLHRYPAPLDITLKNPSDPVAGDLLDVAEGLRIGDRTVRLTGKIDVTALPGFPEGQWWVQDFAASLPAKLFGDLNGKRVLDLCAAPGGKTAQMLAMGAQVTALEKSASRARRLRENLERIGFAERCRVVVGDLFTFEPEVAFDAVLLDAPCSSTGTVRRHPDVPWTKTAADIAKLADLQARMLARAADFVAPSGQLVFSNCSLMPEEGEQVAADFIVAHGDRFSLEPVVAGELSLDGLGITDAMVGAAGMVRTTPAHQAHENVALAGMDGFFAASFRKR